MSKEEKEDSELEEVLDEEELKKVVEEAEEIEIDENQFQEFLQVDNSAPALEQIAGEQEIRWTRTEQREDKSENENAANYSLEKYEKSGESKYDEAPRNFHEEVSTGTVLNVGLARNSETPQQNFTFSTPETQRMQRDATQTTESDYINPKRFEQKNEEMPFEQQDKKYKEFKP